MVNSMHRTNLKGATGLQMTHSLCIFDTLQLKITSSSLSCAWSYPLNLLAWGVFTLYLKLCTVHHLVEVETCCVSNLLQLKTRHGTTTQHGCDLDSSATQSAQLYTLCLKALLSSGSDNYNIKIQIFVMKRN